MNPPLFSSRIWTLHSISSKPVSRVLSGTIICLPHMLPYGSSRLAGMAGQAFEYSLTLLRVGFTFANSRQFAGELLPRLSILTARRQRFISVALSLKSPLPGVIRHPCPVELGLSSYISACDCPAYSKSDCLESVPIEKTLYFHIILIVIISFLLPAVNSSAHFIFEIMESTMFPTFPPIVLK